MFGYFLILSRTFETERSPIPYSDLLITQKCPARGIKDRRLSSEFGDRRAMGADGGPGAKQSRPQGRSHRPAAGAGVLLGGGSLWASCGSPVCRAPGSMRLGHSSEVRLPVPPPRDLLIGHVIVIEAAEIGGPGAGGPHAGLTPAFPGVHSCFRLAVGARRMPTQGGDGGCGRVVSAPGGALRGHASLLCPPRSSGREARAAAGMSGSGDKQGLCGQLSTALCLFVTVQGPEPSPSLQRGPLMGKGGLASDSPGTRCPGHSIPLLPAAPAPRPCCPCWGRDSGTPRPKGIVLAPCPIRVSSGLESVLRQHGPRTVPGTRSVVRRNFLACGCCTETPASLAP